MRYALLLHDHEPAEGEVSQEVIDQMMEPSASTAGPSRRPACWWPPRSSGPPPRRPR